MDRALADIIDRCLAVNPAKRYPNVQSVLNALEARSLRRARRPLMVLGALAPALLLLLMGGMVAQELNTAVEGAKDSLADETRDSNTFAAEAIAEKVAAKIDRRWRVLENDGANPKLKELLTAARGKPVESPEHEALQSFLDGVHENQIDMVGDVPWTLFDEEGYMVARSPHNDRSDENINKRKRFAHRDYFNGRANLEENATPPPLAEPYRSSVFVGENKNARMVAFSAPIFKKDPGPNAPRLGVLRITVEVGDFAELKSEDKSNGFVSVLVDKRPEYVAPNRKSTENKGRAGAIIGHPILAKLRKQGVSEKDEEKMKFYADLEQFDEDGWSDNYADPVGESHHKYAGRLLAASHSVVVEERGEAGDTDWVVVVEEHYEDAIEPVLTLKNDMLRRGIWAMAIAVTLVTGLWLFVIIVLNDSSQSSIFASFKRSIGLAHDSAASAKGTVTGPPVQAKRPPAPPTVTEPEA